MLLSYVLTPSDERMDDRKIGRKVTFTSKDKLTSMIIIFGADAQAKIDFLYDSKLRLPSPDYA